MQALSHSSSHYLCHLCILGPDAELHGHGVGQGQLGSNKNSMSTPGINIVYNNIVAVARFNKYYSNPTQ